MGVRAAASVFALALAGVTFGIAVAQPAKWRAAGSPEDGFSIDFPGEVAVSQDDFDAKKMVRHRQYLHGDGPNGWMVSATRFNPGRTIGDGAWLDLARDAMKGQCTIRDEGRNGFPEGMWLDFVLDKCPDGLIKRVRLYAVGDRYYQVLIAGPPGVERNADTQRFFDSFKLTTAAPAAAASASTAPAPAPPRPQPAAPSAGTGSGVSSMLEGVMQRFPGGPNAAGSPNASGGSQAGKTPTCADEQGAKSVDATVATTIVFQNNRNTRVRIYWLNYQGRREHFQDLAPGRQHVQETYVSHPWIVTEENGRCLGLYMPEATRRQVEIRTTDVPASR